MANRSKINSWRSFPIKQQPKYESSLTDVEKKLELFPSLVSFDEVDDLKLKLKLVQNGEAFILQGGDCAESFFDFKESIIKNYFRLFLQMNAALMYGLKKPIVKIGRVAGQFAKPRSSDVELIDGLEYPSYRGDIINDIDKNNRKPDPQRMIDAYFYSSGTLNYIRALAKSGFSSLENVSKWNEDFLSHFPSHEDSFAKIVHYINDSLAFLKACNVDGQSLSFLNEASFFISHEALLLNYEEALTRFNKNNSSFYDLSAHMLWIGDRTRGLKEAHVEFLSNVSNPVGIKIGPTTDPVEIIEVIKKINPTNESGKVILIVRMGAEKIKTLFEPILQKILSSKLNVIWQTDPMHGNIVKAGNFKTRKFEDIINEIESFFEICIKNSAYPGGIHLEMTGENVTECLGGFQNISDSDLQKRYHTHCDPRLNSIQALELSFKISERLSKKAFR